MNGVECRLERDKEFTVARKFVDKLARCKTTSYTQEKYTGPDNVEAYRYVPVTGLRYPFAVIRDDHPMGADWLTHVLKEA